MMHRRRYRVRTSLIAVGAVAVGLVTGCGSARTSALRQEATMDSSAAAPPATATKAPVKTLQPGPVPAELAVAFAGPTDRILARVDTRSALILSVPLATSAATITAAEAVRDARTAKGSMVPDPLQYPQSVKLALYTQADVGDSSAPSGARTIPDLVWVILTTGVPGPAPRGAQPPPGQPQPSYAPYRADVITLVDAATGAVGTTAYFG